VARKWLGDGPFGQQGPDFGNRTKVGDAQTDQLIRNVYKVLLTRGMRAVAIHSVDRQTNDRLRAITSHPSTDAIR
jgi:hypothetical protein